MSTTATDVGGPRAAGDSCARLPAAPEPARTMRIGEVAERTRTTPRTIRYYEELGLLGEERQRAAGQHRCYDEEDVARIEEVVRLKDLLGLTLEQLRPLVEREAARMELKRAYIATEDPAHRRELLCQLREHNEAKLALVRDRMRELQELDDELSERLARATRLIAELS